MLFNADMKKGDPMRLDGRVTVYAHVHIDPEETINSTHPIISVIQNGLLVAQGNFVEQNSLKDFLNSEMGLSLEDDLEEIINRLGGLESALDPQKLRDKMKSMDEFEDFIPTPAKVVPFHSEEEILSQHGDIFYMGEFENVSNANLCVNAFPIIYQAYYREQQLRTVKNEVEQIISQIEKGTQPETRQLSSMENGKEVVEKILRDYYPHMLYCRNDPDNLTKATKRFRSFMHGYKFQDDVERIISLIENNTQLSPRQYELLELYAKKIAALWEENYAELDELQKKIAGYEESA
jgi:hypothetical protein